MIISISRFACLIFFPLEFYLKEFRHWFKNYEARLYFPEGDCEDTN